MKGVSKITLDTGGSWSTHTGAMVVSGPEKYSQMVRSK